MCVLQTFMWTASQSVKTMKHTSVTVSCQQIPMKLLAVTLV